MSRALGWHQYRFAQSASAIIWLWTRDVEADRAAVGERQLDLLAAFTFHRRWALSMFWVEVNVSQYKVVWLIYTALGSLMTFLCCRASKGNNYVNKTTDVLIRYRLVPDDRERGIKRLRLMLLFAAGFWLLFTAAGVVALVAGPPSWA
jgi:hypothetical protein